MQRYIQCKWNLPWDISRCIKPRLNISSFDTIVVVCRRFHIFGFLGRCWISKHICSRGFIDFIIFGFHATTKSWHAHQKIRFDELMWTKWISEICMDRFIELSVKLFQNLRLWRVFVLLSYYYYYNIVMSQESLHRSPPVTTVTGMDLDTASYVYISHLPYRGSLHLATTSNIHVCVSPILGAKGRIVKRIRSPCRPKLFLARF